MLDRLRYRMRYRYYQRRAAREARSRNYAANTRRLIINAVDGVEQEAKETEEMAQSFFRLLGHKLRLGERKEPPTEEEVKEAIEQLKDVGRLSVFATISIIPGGGFSLIGLELLARKFGVKNFTFVPSSFRKHKEAGLKPDQE